MKKLVVIILLSWLAGTAAAETRYVTDQFKITLRSGESASHKILRMLPSGMPVEVLSSNRASGYSKVRTSDGREGYVLTRQLLREPVARDQLAAAQQRLQELQEAPDKLAAKLSKLQTEHNSLQQLFDQQSKDKKQIETELASIKRTAANAIRVTEERNELRKQVAEMTRQIEELKQENRELKNDSAQDWFIIGGAVVIVGILIGLILPHLRVQRRHKSSWDSL